MGSKVKAFDNLSRILSEDNSCANDARVSISLKKTIWMTAVYLITIIGCYLTYSIENLYLFLFCSAFVLLFGHSLGMHRRLIHKSYKCQKWFEYLGVYMGTLVGIAGPFGMITAHDLRDWAQRKATCHKFFSQVNNPFQDWYWQIFCKVTLAKPPVFEIESEVYNDKFYKFIEKYWIEINIPWVLLFYYIGGIDFVIWGIFTRIAACVTGHWLIGYFAHNNGEMHYKVKNAGVQGYNIWFCGLITMGESYHNNHHAFPFSAKIAIEKWQIDPCWWALKILEKLKIVSELQTYENTIQTKEIEYLNNNLGKEVIYGKI